MPMYKAKLNQTGLKGKRKNELKINAHERVKSNHTILNSKLK